MTDSLTFIGRSLRHSVRSVDALLTAILLPVVIMLMFVYVFGGAIDTGGRYVDYVVPGIIVLCAGFGSRRHRGGGRARHDHRRDRPLPHAADLVRRGADRPRRGQRRAQRRLGAARARRRAAGRLPPDHATRSNWLAAAGLLLALMTAISWLAACFGLLASSVEAANAITFVAAFAPYVSSAFVPADTMPAGLAVGRRPPARHADRRHAARADARHAGRQRVDRRARLVRRGHRDRPRRRRLPVPAPLTLRLARVLRTTPPRSAGSRSATSGSRARCRAPSRPRRTCSRRRARCAACSSTRPRSSPATTCSCSSAATARSTRRCSRRSPTSERDLFEYWAHEASYVLSEDLPIHRHADAAAAAAGATRLAQWWESEADVPRPHPRAPDRGGPAARARHRGPRDGLVGVQRLDARAQRRPHARPDVGARAGRHQPPRGRAARLGPDGALPAAGRAARRS